MKKILSCILALCFILGFTSVFSACKNKNKTPDVVKNTSGYKKLNTKLDYSNAENWLSLPLEQTKDVDVLYFYPTTYTKNQETEEDICDIDNANMRNGASNALLQQASVFSDSCNVFAPFYRQVSLDRIIELNECSLDELFSYMAKQDASDALDYYFKNLNNERPFILAGHSQGSAILAELLKTYFKNNTQYYSRMVASYVIGYSITNDDLNKNTHLKFAQGEKDYGVIVSYNTEGASNKTQNNITVKKGAIAINPLNWKLDQTPADVSLNLGSFINGTLTQGIANATLDTSRGVVVCSSVDSQTYAMSNFTDYFGTESYHKFDYGFYYSNLKDNVAKRIESYFGDYNLWVGETRVTSQNKADVFGDGKVSYEGDYKGGKLIVSNFVLINDKHVEGKNYGIRSQLIDLEIELVGVNSIDADIAIYSENNLKILGSGNLNVTSKNAGIWADKIVIESGTIYIKSVYSKDLGSVITCGLFANELLQINGGDIDCYNSGEASVFCYAVYSLKDIEINGGNLLAGHKESPYTTIGIMVIDSLVIKNGQVASFGVDDAISGKKCIVNGGELIAESKDSNLNGIVKVVSLEINGGVLTFKALTE